MTLETCLIAVVILLLFALFDLIVGVSNDAVNFLSSSIGSKVAPRHVILIIASLGILVGVLFSGGMMEVARKGIFHPQFFTMPELLTLFMAVMLADLVLLDVLNTYGIPTSTTVSIVFELLGAAVAVSLIKVMLGSGDIAELANYINTAKAMAIILGILLSVIVAFIAGAIVQFFVRLGFTFDYHRSLPKWGGIWGGVSLAALTHFILIKGAKHVAFLDESVVHWISDRSVLILLSCFVLGGLLMHALSVGARINILKPIVLLGTFALALAFAANDLVNFIGVPLAGLHAYLAATASADPLQVPMTALQERVVSQQYLLLVAGAVMALTLWFSKKAQKVTSTSVDLGRQDENGAERFESAALSRLIVRMVSSFFETMRSVFPRKFRKFVKRRFSAGRQNGDEEEEDAPSFDLVRASVNLIVASIVVSFATSLKLPLSTTYVTFMVAMGTSFADQAWGRDTAVYRVTGVLTVVGCWFLTAVFGFSVAFFFAYIIFSFEAPGALAVMALVGYIVWKNKHQHETHEKDVAQEEVFNLKKITDSEQALAVSFQHMSIFLDDVKDGLSGSLDALLTQDRRTLRSYRKGTKKIARWASIITANVYKVLRLLSQGQVSRHPDFSLANKSLQNISECYRDVIVRAYEHTRNHHSPLLSIQGQELAEAKEHLNRLLQEIIEVLSDRKPLDRASFDKRYEQFVEFSKQQNERQIERVRNRSSKTRLSILYYAILSDIERISRHSIRLLDIYEEIASDQALKH